MDNTLAHWSAELIETVAARLDNNEAPVVVIRETNEELRRALVNTVAQEASSDTHWSKISVDVLTAVLERPLNTVVIARANQTKHVTQAARLARSQGWLLIVEEASPEIFDSIAGLNPIIAEVNLTLGVK